MKIKILQPKTRSRKASFGFTLVETLMAVLIGATMLATHYLSFAAGFAIVKVTREDVRASQIILRRMEAIRLSSFSQLTDPAKYPASATEYYSEKDQANGHGGVAYTVTFQATPGPAILPPSYRTNVLDVIVGVSWVSGNAQPSRSMRTYVARNGIQTYVSGGY